MTRSSRRHILVVAVALLGATLALLATAPTQGDFWWPDAPRHALNGLFLRDFLIAHPFHDPAGWAIAYYLHRPGLTILFYPPLFYAVEAAAFALFGFSHFVAQACVAAFVLLLGGASYWLARCYLPAWSALGAALLAIGMPEAAFWGRQVMLDVPAYALAVTAVCFTVGYGRTGRSACLYLAALAGVAAIYTKYNAGFIVPVVAVFLLAMRGPGVLRQRHLWFAMLMAAVLLLPAVGLVLKFGGGDVAAVEGLSDTLPLGSLACWLFYLRTLPGQLSLVPLAFGVAGIAAALRQVLLGRSWRLLVPLLVWLLIGYVTFSLISVKEPRHSLMVLLPLAITGPLFLATVLPRRLGEAAGLALGVGTLAYTLVAVPAPSVSGYRHIADYLARTVPKNGIVLFSGYRDGNLLFNLAASSRSDIGVVRLDKLLLSVPAGERRRGVTQSDDNEAAIAALLRGLGASVFVVQPDFWSDLPVMARFDHVIAGPDYQAVTQFMVSGRTSTQDGGRVIDILRPTYPVAVHPAPIDVSIPLAARRFHGAVGAGR
jgi:hypothetical protein